MFHSLQDTCHSFHLDLPLSIVVNSKFQCNAMFVTLSHMFYSSIDDKFVYLLFCSSFWWPLDRNLRKQLVLVWEATRSQGCHDSKSSTWPTSLRKLHILVTCIYIYIYI